MKGEIHIIAKLHRTDLVICSHFREGGTLFYSQINMIIKLKYYIYVVIRQFILT